MEKWTKFPGVFRRKIILTFLTGLGCGSVAAVVHIVSHDCTLLLLGGMILLICICKCIFLWNCAVKMNYHIRSGVCRIPKSHSPLRLRKVLLIDADGEETTLLLDKKAGIKEGYCYRFYFQNRLQTSTGNLNLDAALHADALIGVEMIDADELLTSER